MKLSVQVHNLVESLPEDERSALAASLSETAVRIPTSVAMDLIKGESAEVKAIVSLLTQIELVDRIYPALDTAEVQTAAQNLLVRLQDEGQFKAMIAQAPAPATVDEEADDKDLDEDSENDEEDEDSEDNDDEVSEPTVVHVQPQS